MYNALLLIVRTPHLPHHFEPTSSSTITHSLDFHERPEGAGAERAFLELVIYFILILEVEFAVGRLLIPVRIFP